MKRTEVTLQSGQPDAIERHCKALKAVIAAVDDCRRTVEEQKIIEKESLDDIGEWNVEINAKPAEADDVKRMKEWLESLARPRNERTRREN